MSVFITSSAKGETFTRAAYVSRAPYQPRGWAIFAYSDDTSLYGGSYIKDVGYADTLTVGTKVPFRLKRDATAALREAVALGILN